MLSANAAFDPVRPVMFATVRRGERDDSIPLIGDRVTSLCTDLFNVSYEIILQILERYFTMGQTPRGCPDQTSQSASSSTAATPRRTRTGRVAVLGVGSADARLR
jgi:hypothetical protein